MKRTNIGKSFSLSQKRSIRLLILFGLFCIVLGILVCFVCKNELSSVPPGGLMSESNGFSNSKHFVMESEEKLEEKEAPICPVEVLHRSRAPICPLGVPHRLRAQEEIRSFMKTQLSGLNFAAGIATWKRDYGIYESANDALELGRKLWEELELNEKNTSNSVNKLDQCPHWISVSGDEFAKNGKVIVLPCGLTVGSQITVVGKPRKANMEKNLETSPLKEGQNLMVSQFMLELQGLKMVEGEEPPKILHFNPRLKGDWSGKPVIEFKTCYRMKCETSQRCEGWKSRADENVDGLVKCEKWIRNDDHVPEESKVTRWLNQLIGRTKKVAVDWPFPFAEGKFFVLTLTAGLDGYHVNVDGRHITSFPYRTGFTMEDATGLSLNGDVDVFSIFSASLPTSAPQKYLDFSDRWKAPPIPDGPVELFIGILSAGSHFAERMAVRKSWVQHEMIKSSNVVARFFVALHDRKEVNEEVKIEAKFFGDIVLVPYMDQYDLVVLKTLAICEYGVRTVAANYIMKCDDDTFVRIDAIINEAKKVKDQRSFYMGKINYNHEPMRAGIAKWVVTLEEWPEEEGYPPYASGPGYVISSDIANSIVSDFEKHELKLFKLEDVCMGMWVEKVSKSRPVEYIHSSKFCPSGCIEDYMTAHYQSPGQMICLWNKLRQQGRPLCCDI